MAVRCSTSPLTRMPGPSLFVATSLNHSHWVLCVFHHKSCMRGTEFPYFPLMSSFWAFFFHIRLDNCLKALFGNYIYIFGQGIFTWIIGNQLFYPFPVSLLFKSYPSLCFKLRILSKYHDQLSVSFFHVELTLLI